MRYAFMFFLVWTIIALFTHCTNGIVRLPGYEHAAVVCGEALVVNHGHYNDPQIQLLIERAEKECP